MTSDIVSGRHLTLSVFAHKVRKKKEDRLRAEGKPGWEKAKPREKEAVVAIVLANFQKQQKNHKAQSWLCVQNRPFSLPLSSLLPPREQNNTIKCPISPFWWARDRDTEAGRERVGGWSEALAASRWFGAFCIAVSIQAWARSWHVVRKQLGIEKKQNSPDALRFVSNMEFCSWFPLWFQQIGFVQTCM